MNAPPVPVLQHIVASGLVLAAGLAVAWASYTAAPAEAYLFPRLISAAWVALAAWTFGKALLRRTRVGAGLHLATLLRLSGGLAVMLAYVFWAASAIGFYSGGALAMFAIVSLYDPAPHGALRSWILRALVTAGFMAVIYLLFARLLGVYTPRGMFI